MADTKDSPSYTLYVYATRYSGWGARVSLILAYFAIPHTLQTYSLSRPPPLHLSPSGLLPILQPDPSDPDFLIADSLAISEYLAERHPALGLWPADAKLRARARAAAAQMHAGFGALRDTYHSSYVARYTGAVPVSDAAARESRQLVELWSAARAGTRERLRELGEEDGGFLFGGFSIADAFFWPVLWRFRSYGLPMTGISEDGLRWVAKMWEHPVMKAQGREYFRQAREPWTRAEKYEDIFRGNPDVEYSQFTEDWTFDASKV
ncbi:hypothetical protein F5B20DRAFT_593141 [Whalleya microplaca]|nr:hypothetical protein F5B20DRAFT_593141 [Whalleya microplaca]